MLPWIVFKDKRKDPTEVSVHSIWILTDNLDRNISYSTNHIHLLQQNFLIGELEIQH